MLREQFAVPLHADLQPPAVQFDQVAAELVNERGVEPEGSFRAERAADEAAGDADVFRVGTVPRHPQVECRLE